MKIRRCHVNHSPVDWPVLRRSYRHLAITAKNRSQISGIGRSMEYGEDRSRQPRIKLRKKLAESIKTACRRPNHNDSFGLHMVSISSYGAISLNFWSSHEFLAMIN